MKYKTKTNMIIVSILAVIVIFYAGMKFGQSQNSRGGSFTRGQGLPGQGFQQGQNSVGGMRTGAGMRGGSGVVGQIVSIDEKSMTVQQRDGSSKIVFLAESTSVTKSAPGSAKDLSVGQQVTITGTTNSDGSETAQFVQIRPAMPKTVDK